MIAVSWLLRDRDFSYCGRPVYTGSEPGSVCLDESSNRVQRGFTDVVLDALGIGFGVGGVDAQFVQKCDDELMACLGLLREPLALRCQENRPVGFGLDQAGF